jgi:hypothetical protein
VYPEDGESILRKVGICLPNPTASHTVDQSLYVYRHENYQISEIGDFFICTWVKDALWEPFYVLLCFLSVLSLFLHFFLWNEQV